jgi:hypothetical protein
MPPPDYFCPFPRSASVQSLVYEINLEAILCNVLVFCEHKRIGSGIISS